MLGMVGEPLMIVPAEMARFSHDLLPPDLRGVLGSGEPLPQKSDLPPASLMDMGFAITCSLARHRRPHIRFLFIGSRLAPRFFQARLGASVISTLRFPNPSLPSVVHVASRRPQSMKMDSTRAMVNVFCAR